MTFIDEIIGLGRSGQSPAPATTATRRYLTADEYWALLTQAPQFNRLRTVPLANAPDDDDDQPEARLAALVGEASDPETDYPDDVEAARDRSDVTAAMYEAQLRALAQQED